MQRASDHSEIWRKSQLSQSVSRPKWSFGRISLQGVGVCLLDNHPLTQSLATRNLGKSWLWHSYPHVCWVWRCSILGWGYLCFLHPSILGKWFWAEHLHIIHTHTPTMLYSPHLFFFFNLLFYHPGSLLLQGLSLWRSGATLQLRCVDFPLQWLFLRHSHGL